MNDPVDCDGCGAKAYKNQICFCPDAAPKHRDIAAGHLVSAEETIDGLGPADTAIALAQTHALIAIGHALVDLAKDGIEVFR